MAKIQMRVVGQPFRGVAVGDVVTVSLKDSRAFADNLAPLEAVKAGPRAPTKKAAAKKVAAKKAPAKKTYGTRAMKAG